MTPITLCPTKYVRAWPRHEIGGAVEVVDLRDALEHDYQTDAHFALYATPNGRRLSGEAVDHLEVELHVVAFDVDCVATHGTSEPAPESWRRALRERVQCMATDHPGPYYYETRGGARIVYVQPEASVIRSRADAREWSQDYAIACAYLRRRYGIEADPSCADWTRLFRLPRATRDRAPSPENYPMWTAPDGQIGTLYIQATHADMRAARATSKAFQERQTCDLTHVPSDGMGLLFHVLRARDAVGRRHGDGWLIRCPNAAQHSAGRDWDSSTVLYPPSRDHEIGAICCKHAHCVDLTIRDWLALFSDAELETARRAAGIQRRDAR